MRIGFVDCMTNKLDVREFVVKAFEEKSADAAVIAFSAPDLLKVPASAKKMFFDGADAVLVYLNPGDEEKHAMDLVHEKIIDVEVEYGRFVFLCIVFEDEYRSEEQLKAISEKKLGDMIELIIKTVQVTGVVSQGEVPSSVGDALGMMTGETPAQEEEEDIHSLF